MNKEKARELAKNYRKTLSEEDYYRLSMLITYRLCYAYPFKEAHKYHFFVGAKKKKEIITKPLIDVLIKSGRSVFIPKVSGEFKLQVHPISSLNDISVGAFGIEEPTTAESSERDFDAIIIPMMAADFKGGRVGYGKGFYDRFLKESSGIKIGLVYDNCIFESIMLDSNDIAMDIIITESRIIELRKS